MDKNFRVGIIGGTGMVGQRFVTLLENHPWFHITVIAASASSAGKTYAEAVDGRWKMTTPVPESVKDLVVMNASDVDEIASQVDFVFSAVSMPKDKTRELEDRYAKAEVPVVSNNSAHRNTPDVPMVIPEVNDAHYAVIDDQKKRLGTKKGFVAVKPNCSIQCYVPALWAWREFEPYEVLVSTYQAISGAGKTFNDWPEMRGNIIPYIGGEEEKSEKEPLKIFGEYKDGKIVNSQDIKITSQCLRVPVLDGHMASIFVKFKKDPTKEELIDRLENFKGFAQTAELPNAPHPFIKYFTEDDRPQVTLDADFQNGFGVTFGRLREDSLFDWKLVGLAHNTVRGAAGGGVLSAEALVAKGYI